ncbi:MAG: hypothetical protein CM1200mP39_25210 [Dehalococcoidia bacterium]|nr:MAG: hypothetical protein CM1200mP39_25210 [Dehalococcoidia bacterium]
MSEAETHPSGRLSGVIYPMQIDTCSEDLLRDCVALAEETDRPITTTHHSHRSSFSDGEAPWYFPDQMGSNIGLLSPRTTPGHAIFVDEHPSIGWRTKEE